MQLWGSVFMLGLVVLVGGGIKLVSKIGLLAFGVALLTFLGFYVSLLAAPHLSAVDGVYLDSSGSASASTSDGSGGEEEARRLGRRLERCPAVLATCTPHWVADWGDAGRRAFAAEELRRDGALGLEPGAATGLARAAAALHADAARLLGGGEAAAPRAPTTASFVLLVRQWREIAGSQRLSVASVTRRMSAALERLLQAS